MIIIDNLLQVANQIESERGVDKHVLFSAIEQALASACRKKYHDEVNTAVELNQLTGEARIYIVKVVVDEVEDENLEITKEAAKQFIPSPKLGDEVKIEDTSSDFGRLAAQTAKQVIVQRIREAEKDSVYDEFKDKVGQILTGTVQRIENRNYLINLGRTEAILHYKDQIPGENFQLKEKIKVYVASIEKGTRGNQIYISRSHEGLLKRMFEVEIPEIQDNIIEIVNIARDAGKRSKIAVKSNNPTIGAVGTCVGQMGNRIQSILKEIGNEKIDVLEWTEDPKAFISNALKPAKISSVHITNATEKEATVVVPNDQLSLAIGKQGINVRLSVKLTGWKLDIIDEKEFESKEEEITGKKQLSIAEKIRLHKESEKEQEDESTLHLSPLAQALANALKAEKEQEAAERAENDAESEEETENEENLTKVSDLAKQLGLKTQDLIDKVKEFGIDIPNNRSKLSAETVEKIKASV